MDHDAAHEGAPVGGVFDEDPIRVRIAAPLVLIVPRFRHRAQANPRPIAAANRERVATNIPIYGGFYPKRNKFSMFWVDLAGSRTLRLRAIEDSGGFGHFRGRRDEFLSGTVFGRAMSWIC